MSRALLFLLPLLAGAADLKIDHATVAGRDVRAMMDRLASIGIHSEYGGPHNNHATEMALISFPDGSYLELIAPQPKAQQSVLKDQPWTTEMQNDAGPCAWAIRVTDLSAVIDRLKAEGIATGQAQRSGRQRPDGKRLEWETAQIGDEPRGTFFPFAIRDLTPRQDRAFLHGKAATKDFGGVTRVVIAVKDIRESAKRYIQAFQLAPPIEQVDAAFGAKLALFNATPVVLAAPVNAQSWIAKRIEQNGEGPCAFILSAKKPRNYAAVSKSRWGLTEISWFDVDKLGWHLGFE